MGNARAQVTLCYVALAFVPRLAVCCIARDPGIGKTPGSHFFLVVGLEDSRLLCPSRGGVCARVLLCSADVSAQNERRGHPLLVCEDGEQDRSLPLGSSAARRRVSQPQYLSL